MINDYNYQSIVPECSGCTNRGFCSVSSTLSSVQEIILLYLRELSFYLLKLKPYGITNERIKEDFISTLFNIICNIEYSQETFHTLIENLYNYIYQSKILYEQTCTEKNITPERNKSYFKYSKNFSLTDAIRKGEKYFLKKNTSFSPRQKDFHEITLFLAKSICVKLIELQKMDKDYDIAYYEILKLFNELISTECGEEEFKIQIEESIRIYYGLIKRVFYQQIKLYGKPTKAEVNFSTHLGHAILVSGSDYKKLENVLKATEGKNINVYTHGPEMLMAHSFPKLNSHNNLKGHFGTSIDSSLIDFASFPGPILMTKGALHKMEYLYRGRLYTLDPVAPSGIIRIENDNYEPLIKSALETKGFVSSQKKPPMIVGFDGDEVESALNDVIKKIKNKEIKNLHIIGLLNTPNIAYKEYFQTFFSLMPKDNFVISICCPLKAENVLNLDSFFDYSLFYQIIKKLKMNLNFAEISMTVFVTRCDKHTIANLIYLRKIGIKNIFLCKCLPSLITPNLLSTLENVFDIKQITTPQKDLNDILNEN